MYYVSFVAGNVVVGCSEVISSSMEVLADGRLEFFDVKANKTADAVFVHCLKLDVLTILPLILSRISLLILPISDLEGLVSLQVSLLAKFGLWSFSVKNVSLIAVVSTLCHRCPVAMYLFSLLGEKTLGDVRGTNTACSSSTTVESLEDAAGLLVLVIRPDRLCLIVLGSVFTSYDVGCLQFQ